MKKIKASQNENLTDILKLLTKRIEEATVDIHQMKKDLEFSEERLGNIENNIGIIKVDIEKMRYETKESIELLEKKIMISEKRIIKEVGEFISDSILPQLDDKADKKDVQRLEQKLDSLLHAN